MKKWGDLLSSFKSYFFIILFIGAFFSIDRSVFSMAEIGEEAAGAFGRSAEEAAEIAEESMGRVAGSVVEEEGEVVAQQGERILSGAELEVPSIQESIASEVSVGVGGEPMPAEPAVAPTDTSVTEPAVGKSSAEVAQAKPQEAAAISSDNVAAQKTGPAAEKPATETSTKGKSPEELQESKIKEKEAAYTDKQDADKALKQAEKDAKAAKENLEKVRKTGTPEEIQAAQDDYVAKQENLSKAKIAKIDADITYKEAWRDASYDQWSDAAKIRDTTKVDLETAQTKVKGAQQELDQVKAKQEQLEKQGPPGRDDPKYTRDGEFDEEKFKADENAYNQQKERLVAEEKLAQQKLDAANGELKEAKDNFNNWKNKSRLEGAKWAGSKAFEGLKFLGEQMAMSAAFSIVPDIFQSITQTLQNKELYEEITKNQTFGGITMRVVPGLVSERNPAGGFFLYYDVDSSLGDKSPSQDYLTSPARRWFVSFDPNDTFTKPGSSYISSSRFPYMMLELSTGFVFDASGAAVDPFNPTITLLKNTEINDIVPTKGQIVENLLTEDIYGPVSGMRSDSSYDNLSAVSLFSGDLKPHESGSSGNTTVANLLKGSKSSDLPPILQPTVDAYKIPTAVPNFGTTTNPFLVSELQGLGGLIRVLGEGYFSIFQPYNSSQITSDGAKFLASLQAANGSLSTLDNALTPFSSYTQNGFSPNADPVGLGFYVYQTDSTPTALFLKNFVKDSSSQDLANYVHDYVILLDQNQTPVPATLPMITKASGSSTVQLVPNPNVEQIVSIVSGLTYSAHNGYQPVLQDAEAGSSLSPNVLLPGPANYALANAWLKSKQATSASTEFANQLSQMQILLNLAVQQGPFQLSGGKVAVRVPASAMFGDAYEKDKQTAETAQELGDIAKGAGISQENIPFWVQQASTKESYIYMIHDAFEIAQKDATGKVIGHVSLPDYVVPVTVGTDGRYVLVPLGTTVMHKANFDLPAPSSSVQALISLVTSRMYAPDYTPLPTTYTTTVGNRSNQPLYTAFMETEFNPANKGTFDTGDLTKVPPFYFLYLNEFSYCSTAASGGTFVNTYRCDKPTALPSAFINILPESFTGIPLVGKEEAAGTSVKTPSENDGPVVTTANAIKVALDDIAKGKIPTIEQVHLAWASQMFGEDSSAAKLASEPLQFTQNQGVNDWFITATGIADIQNGNFFYQTNQAAGLWVVANYSGADNKVTGPVKDLASAGFTNIGKDFNTTKGNALLNVGTGQALINMQNPDSKSGQFYVVNPLGRYDKNGNLINEIRFNPADVLSAAITSQGKQPLSGGVLQKLIVKLQSGNVGTQIGPVLFGKKRLYIDRTSYNEGNFVYVEYASDGKTPQDYFVTVDSNQSYATKPVDGTTTTLASMVSGLRYNSSGTLSLFEQLTEAQENYADETSELTSKNLFYQFLEGIIQAQSGVPLDQTIRDSIAKLASNYATQKAASPQESAAQSAYEIVLNLALKSKAPVSQLNAAIPLDGTDGIIKTADGQYYWRSMQPSASSGSGGSGEPMYQYYQFKFTSNDLPSSVPQPVGVLYDHTGNAIEVYTGNRAAGMLVAHGITETKNGVLSMGIPVRHGSLPMTTSDTNLAGGKTGGFLMKLVPDAQNPLHVTTNNQTFYIYKNIFHSGSVPPVTSIGQVAAQVSEYSPYDLLLQVTPQGNAANAYYLSLLSGCMYDIGGQQIPSPASLYFLHAQGQASGGATAPSLVSNLPLVMWGDGNATEAVLRMGTNGDVGDFLVDKYGAEYQYVDAGGTLFNFTYGPFEQYGYCVSADTGEISVSDGNGTCPSGTWPVVGGLESICMVSDTKALIDKTGSDGKQTQYGRLVKPSVTGSSSSPVCPAGSSLLPQIKSYCAPLNGSRVVSLKPTSGSCPSGSYPIDPTGVVYKVQVSPDGKNNTVVATYPSDGSAPTGSPYDIQNAAQNNMAMALDQAQKDKLYPSQQVFNMSTQSSPIVKVQLRQNQLQGGVINVYQQGQLKGTYEPINQNLWKAHALNYVGTRTSGSTATTTHLNFKDTAIIFDDAKTDAIDGLIWGGTYYQKGSSAGTFTLPGNSSSTITATLKTAQELYGANAETDLVSNWNVTVLKQSDGKCPANSELQSDGTCLVVPAALPKLVQTTSHQKYLSVIADGTEYVYEFIYSEASPEAVQAMLKGLNNAIIAQSSNGIVSIVSQLDFTALAPLTSTLSGDSPESKLQNAYTAAAKIADSASSAVKGVGGKFFNNMKSQNTALQSSAKNNPLVGGGVVNANSNATTTIVDNALLGASGTATSTSADITKNGLLAVAQLNARMSERATLFDSQSPSLYYNAKTKRVYVKISTNLLAYMPDASAAVGQYVHYQMDEEPAGFIFNGSDVVDANKKSIAGTPTGRAITPLDMVALKHALGNLKVHQGSNAPKLAPSQSLYIISGGGVSFDDYYSFADLMPGVFTPPPASSSNQPAPQGNSSIGKGKK